MVDSTIPAVLGGLPVRPQGPSAWPLPDADVLNALQTAYADGSWGKYHGGNVERLEEHLARWHEVDFALTCGSGTFAVELALRSLKIGPGDEVILAAYDYGGNFLSVHAVGASPVLVDVSASNWNLDPHKIEDAVGPTTRALIVSHLHGGFVPMREVMDIAGRKGLRVIEDAAQMPGALIQGRKAGTWGDAGILSFGGSKLLTAGRGGCLLTRHADVRQRARLWLNRGNNVCPLSELQATVLLPQLAKLDACNDTRARNVALLIESLHGIPGLRPFAGEPLSPAAGERGRGEGATHPSPLTKPGYYKLGFQYDEARFGLSRERFLEAVRAEGIAVDEGFRALHVSRSTNRFRQGSDLTEADRAHRGTVILHHPVLLGPPKDIEEVAVAIRKIQAHVASL